MNPRSFWCAIILSDHFVFFISFSPGRDHFADHLCFHFFFRPAAIILPTILVEHFFNWAFECNVFSVFVESEWVGTRVVGQLGPVNFRGQDQPCVNKLTAASPMSDLYFRKNVFLEFHVESGCSPLILETHQRPWHWPPSRAKNSTDYRNNTLLAGAFANPVNPLSRMSPNHTHLTLQPF